MLYKELGILDNLGNEGIKEFKEIYLFVKCLCTLTIFMSEMWD